MLTQSEILEELLRYKKKNGVKYGIEEIGLFGSYARDEALAQSDIDIYIRLKKSNLLLLSRIRIDLAEIFDKSIDIVELRKRMNSYLKKHIEKEAISA